uniref:Uncharacterized protein n=1 Tax=mine drainage metagenome TaxID=410659 RepID=E6QLW7_9ZZZZ
MANVRKSRSVIKTILGTLIVELGIGVPLYIAWIVTRIWFETGRLTVAPDRVMGFFLAHQGAYMIAVVWFVIVFAFALVAPREN